MEKNKEFYISPNLENDNLTETINCINEAGENIEIPVVKEIPLTIYLNKQEIVTAMTLGDMPDILAVGYLLNQNMLQLPAFCDWISSRSHHHVVTYIQF